MISRVIELLSLYPKLRKLFGFLLGIALLLIIVALIEHNDRLIMGRQSKHGFVADPVLQNPRVFTDDEHRIANLFIADTLPRLMKKGLITKYERTGMNTTIFVVGRVWKARTHFVKESLLTAVLVYNKVNGFNPWTRILDDRDGRLYAQVLPSDRKELYE